LGRNRCYAELKILGSGGGGAWLVVVSYRFSGTDEPSPLFESVLIFENNFDSLGRVKWYHFCKEQCAPCCEGAMRAIVSSMSPHVLPR
jgi:hypothetical protein